jgi:hypothetical protein
VERTLYFDHSIPRRAARGRRSPGNGRRFKPQRHLAGLEPGIPSRLVKPQKATESEIEPTQDDLVSA